MPKKNFRPKKLSCPNHGPNFLLPKLLHQLNAPMFKPMLQYASKLEERPIFLNMNEICYLITVVKKLFVKLQILYNVLIVEKY